jgi:hypothetical protein
VTIYSTVRTRRRLLMLSTSTAFGVGLQRWAGVQVSTRATTAGASMGRRPQPRPPRSRSLLPIRSPRPVERHRASGTLEQAVRELVGRAIHHRCTQSGDRCMRLGWPASAGHA